LKVLEARVPIVLLAPVSSDHQEDPAGTTYQAIFPVYIHRYTRWDTSFEFDVSQAYTLDAPAVVAPYAQVYERRWSSGVVQRRLHQPLFQRDVLAAYQARCAVCGLDVAELLDAAHIVPDRHELGVAWVRNGMALCKNHHAAYDADLLAVSPDLTIRIAPPLLSASGIKFATHDAVSSLDGSPLTVIPAVEHRRPDPDRLAVRFSEFEHKWSIPPTPYQA
jgi:putative restriction endonuclease